ncbi:MAG: phospholipid carrier-dependent glycosyltransferase [Candidatus Yanofskybacteria bacterium]|nr:phospholipid carrier-dependent glycosyltransferase [Candidatus Yanofskybacteria bacterium]
MAEYKKVYLIILIITSLATHFLFFGQPRETVFDEVHFGKFISGYFTHEYFFDIHPPLGKLLISGVGYVSGFEPGFSFAQIGQQFPDNTYLWLRLLPTIAGMLLPIVVYFLILQLGMSRLAAFVGGMLVVLENATLVQSRFILLDSLLLLFGFSALLFYFFYHPPAQHRMSYKWGYLLLSGILSSLAISVKWTGASFLAIIGMLYLIDWLNSEKKLIHLIRGVAFLFFVPVVIYFSIFALHFSLLTKSGPGDAFMTPTFRKTLTGSTDSKNPDLKPLNIFEKFKELNFQMYRSNAGLAAGHPYSSKWYTWPFMIRPIYYWNQSPNDKVQMTNGGQQSKIYFLGNPVIWWTSTIAMFFLIISLIAQIFRRALSKIIKMRIPVLLAGAYFLNILPFVGIRRAMFLYHYLIGLIFAIIALVYLLDRLPNKKRAFIALLIVSIAAFVFFMPLTYGLPLTEKLYNLRVWLQTWL